MSEWLTGLFWWFLVLSFLVPMIAYAIRKHPAVVTVFVPHYAMSGGTLVALAANHLVMDENAALGPVDPQLMQPNEGPYPAPSVLAVVKQKGVEKVDDKTLLLADIAEKSLRQVRGFLRWLLTETLMELYPQPVRRQPSVEYLPLPGPAPAGRQPVKR